MSVVVNLSRVFFYEFLTAIIQLINEKTLLINIEMRLPDV
jgi:hypothetical protein